jgi:hypothetical protein
MKYRGQFHAETVDYGDDRDRDTGSDEPVFDGCGAAFVLEKGGYAILHWKLFIGNSQRTAVRGPTMLQPEPSNCPSLFNIAHMPGLAKLVVCGF